MVHFYISICPGYNELEYNLLLIRVFGQTHTVLRSRIQYKPIVKLTNIQNELLVLSLQAGIQENQLSLALEPESAAICCKDMALRKTGGLDGIMLKAFDPGQKYIVVDCGGMWTCFVFCCLRVGVTSRYS